MLGPTWYRPDMTETAPTGPPPYAAVTLSPLTVGKLTGYLTRALDWDAPYSSRDDARTEMAGYLAAVLGIPPRPGAHQQAPADDGPPHSWARPGTVGA